MVWKYDLKAILMDKKIPFREGSDYVIVTVNITKNSKKYDELVCRAADPKSYPVIYGSFSLTNAMDVNSRMPPLVIGTIYSPIDFEQRILHACFNAVLSDEAKLKLLSTDYTVDALGRDIEALKLQIARHQSHDTQEIRKMEAQLESLQSQMAKVVELLHTIAGTITENLPRQ
jgi:hypothetical protein